MQLRFILINIFISLFSIYTPLFFYSFYKFISNTNKIFNEESLSAEIVAANEGYFPLFYPDKILENKIFPESYPIGTLPFTSTYFCNEGYGLITFESDRFGLRNNDNNWNNVLNKSNIFIVGDSFAQGACVPDDYTITTQLEGKTRENIINMSSASNGPYEYQAVIKSILKPIIKNSKKNNTAILIFYPNDNISFNQKRQNLLDSTNSIVNLKSNGDVVPKDKYVKDINAYIKSNYPITKIEIIKEIKKSGKKRLNSFKQSPFYYIFSLLPVRRDLRVVLTEVLKIKTREKTISPSIKVIESLANICTDLCKPIIMYIPPSNYWTRYLKADNFKNKLKKKYIKYGINFIDGEEVIDRNNINDYAPKGEHLSLKGFKKISDLINRNLVN